MQLCSCSTRALELFVQDFAGITLRRQRAQSFLRHHRAFSTRPLTSTPEVVQEAAQNGRNAVDVDGVTLQDLHPLQLHTIKDVTPPILPIPAAAVAEPEKSRAESRLERKQRRLQEGAYRPVAEARKAGQAETNQMQTVLSKLEELDGPSIAKQAKQAKRKALDAFKKREGIDQHHNKEDRSAKEEKATVAKEDKPAMRRPKKEPWQIHKQAMESKFGEQRWAPRKRLSPDTLEGIRALHASDPNSYSTETLSEHFKVSPDAIRRILKSKWKPNEDEVEDRRTRWERRGVKKWAEMAELGMRPPVKWRAMGVGSQDGVKEERVPKRASKRKTGRREEGLSWDEVVGGLEPVLEEGRGGQRERGGREVVVDGRLL